MNIVTTEQPGMSFHDLLKGIDDSTTVLEAHRQTARQINSDLPGEQITADEFAAALMSPVVTSAIKIYIQQQRDPELFSEPHHD